MKDFEEAMQEREAFLDRAALAAMQGRLAAGNRAINPALAEECYNAAELMWAEKGKRK
jgi:hypothetical protein